MSGWAGREVVVTGANGFLGSWLTAALVERGARVTCLMKEDLPLSVWSQRGLGARVQMVPGILEDVGAMERLFEARPFEVCFHLAAQPIVTAAQADPRPTLEANVQGTWNLLEAARRRGGLAAIVVTTSDKVYGDAERLPYEEGDALLGRDPYEASKACADILAQTYFRTYGLPIGIARCGNFYGPGDLQWSRIVPGTIRSLVEGQRPVIRSDGTYVRDYFYVEDAVEAVLTLAERLEKPDVHGHAFNFGTETPTRVLDVVAGLTRLAKRPDLAPLVLDEARGEIRAQYLSCAKALRMLGWHHRTPLPEGLARSWEWYVRFLAEHPEALSA